MLVISNRPHASRLSDFEITRLITPWIVLHAVQLLLLILTLFTFFSMCNFFNFIFSLYCKVVVFVLAYISIEEPAHLDLLIKHYFIILLLLLLCLILMQHTSTLLLCFSD